MILVDKSSSISKSTFIQSKEFLEKYREMLNCIDLAFKYKTKRNIIRTGKNENESSSDEK